jgi:hypothetical protein
MIRRLRRFLSLAGAFAALAILPGVALGEETFVFVPPNPASFSATLTPTPPAVATASPTASPTRSPSPTVSPTASPSPSPSPSPSRRRG